MGNTNYYGKGDDDTIWVENLLSSRSVYRSEHTKNRYVMEPAGYLGSIVAIPVKVAKESFLQRAVDRGRIAIISDAAANKKQDTLVLREDSHDGLASFEAALAEGASDAGSRYAKELSESGNEQGSYSVSDIVDDIKNPSKQTIKTKSPKKVKSASAAKQAAESEDITVEVTEAISDGDWPAVPDVEV